MARLSKQKEFFLISNNLCFSIAFHKLFYISIQIKGLLIGEIYIRKATRQIIVL